MGPLQRCPCRMRAWFRCGLKWASKALYRLLSLHYHLRKQRFLFQRSNAPIQKRSAMRSSQSKLVLLDQGNTFILPGELSLAIKASAMWLRNSAAAKDTKGVLFISHAAVSCRPCQYIAL